MNRTIPQIRQPIGDIMALQLYDHQTAALEKMKNGCILCGGVGTGKSRTAIAYYYKEQGGGINELRRMVNPKDLYIITTALKRDKQEWEGELIPFLLSTDPERNLYSNRVVVDSWNNIKKYVGVKNAFFIFDEQRVIGYGAWTKAFLAITRSNDWILLSATPGDTWMDYIPVFIANGFYRNKTEFMRRHVIMNRFSKFPKIDKYVDTGRLNRMRRYILVNMEFDKKTVSHHEDIFTSYDWEKYKNVIRTRWDPYKNEPIINAGSLCYVFRRIVNSDNSRIEAVQNLVASRKRVIIFYNFDYELYILKNCHYGDGYSVAEWNGHVHEPIPDSDKWVYLVQYAAGSEGWNCTLTDTIIFYSQSYSYRTMTQASGRIDRLNSPYTDLYFYHLKSRAPIDIAIARALSTKKKFNEERFAEGYLKK